MNSPIQINIPMTACAAERLVKELQDMIRCVRKDTGYTEHMTIADFNGVPINISISNCPCQPEQVGKVTMISPSVN